MAVTVAQLDGRKWTDAGSGSSVTERYQILGNAIGAAPAWTYTGLPVIGSEHPSLTGMYVQSIDFEEGSGAEKNRIIATVKYGPTTLEGQGQGETPCIVTSWGWDAGTDEKELTTAADGTPILNTAGDVFEQVPSVSTPAPVFTKVVRFRELQEGALDYNCVCNSSNVTIAGKTCLAGTLLACISVEKLIDQDDFRYQYTIQLKYKSNLAKIEDGSSLEEIGWHLAITSAGMRQKNQATGQLELITIFDAFTGKPAQVTSPELLDANGTAISRSASGTPPEPYNIPFPAYDEDTFPSWFYSEPE